MEEQQEREQRGLIIAATSKLQRSDDGHRWFVPSQTKGCRNTYTVKPDPAKPDSTRRDSTTTDSTKPDSTRDQLARAGRHRPEGGAAQETLTPSERRHLRRLISSAEGASARQ